MRRARIYPVLLDKITASNVVTNTLDCSCALLLPMGDLKTAASILSQLLWAHLAALGIQMGVWPARRNLVRLSPSIEKGWYGVRVRVNAGRRGTQRW